MLIDTHAHLDDRRFRKDVDAVIERAAAAGVQQIINPGANLEATRLALELSVRFDSLRACAGVSPHDTADTSPSDWADLDAIARAEPVVAIGEIGLDYHYFKEADHRRHQQECFRRQLDLAADLGLPVIIHCREAHADMHAILTEHTANRTLRGVMHCFGGTTGEAAAYLELGLFISFTGVLTFSNAHGLRDVARSIPLDRTLIETDSPYMAPPPHRGKRCEPAYVRLVAEKLAEVHSLPLEEIARITTENAVRLFDLPGE